MHTKQTLLRDLENMRIDPRGTLFVHSSYKAIGPVEGGPDTVLDALTEYMQDGLLALPAHTWSYINGSNPRFNVQDSATCVGILTELFRKRPGVLRSLHPTHSVCALGRDAADFIAGNELCDTPCGRQSSYGKLLDREATILFIGVDLCKNTFIHGVEEWNDIPNRLTDRIMPYVIELPDGSEISAPSRKHCGELWSYYFWKVNDLFIREGIMYTGHFGYADTRVTNAATTNELLSRMLKADPELFSTNEPLARVGD
ncbi:AAC(3) family N-acetyltransferase [Paenibacillus sacheonensis]|uniref:Aminoglycoside N(3)-acetyltransferase n=1 Tax=Paenibacillus sacheonensis TaxID=742054 RepID=A0A7X4YT50_9BACL|nr:AAC(3) family N-acetyltransferase [Paenibacillus sacheonensis]MBM7568387.1 aminoglycoside 3-N-acetyltransferase [Paenibacillus sacheonensis]NBC72086.1 aminoglycoside N(3)-acetyltransferase [Paenibacillus sacheonensis]